MRVPSRYVAFATNGQDAAHHVLDTSLLKTDSPFFAELLSKNDIDEPVILKSISTFEFNAFVELFSPSPIEEQRFTCLKKCEAVLRLTSLWKFTNLRTKAISLTSPLLDSIQKIELGRRFGHLPWVVDGFVALCQRPRTISEEEGAHLSNSDLVTYVQTREKLPRNLLGALSSSNQPSRVWIRFMLGLEPTVPDLTHYSLPWDPLNKRFHSSFYDLVPPEEQLISEGTCTLHKKGRCDVFVTEKRICFKNWGALRISIEWSDITSMKKVHVGVFAGNQLELVLCDKM